MTAAEAQAAYDAAFQAEMTAYREMIAVQRRTGPYAAAIARGYRMRQNVLNERTIAASNARHAARKAEADAAVIAAYLAKQG